MEREKFESLQGAVPEARSSLDFSNPGAIVSLLYFSLFQMGLQLPPTIKTTVNISMEVTFRHFVFSITYSVFLTLVPMTPVFSSLQFPPENE